MEDETKLALSHVVLYNLVLMTIVMMIDKRYGEWFALLCGTIAMAISVSFSNIDKDFGILLRALFGWFELRKQI